jgi:uncharacterized sporulation protein YeaH/YhbH (DUF444 family)
MTQIIDRRFGDKNRSAVNRQRFIRRFKNQIKKAVTEAIARRSITDIEKGEKVFIPAKDLAEPIFHHGLGGKRENIYPLNKEFMTGDRIKRPLEEAGKGQGSHASNDETTGSDEFGFEISREEFLDLFFEDLALPDMIKKQIKQAPSYVPVRAGYRKYGTPTTLNLRRSMRNALGRRIAFGLPAKKMLAEAEEKLLDLQQQFADDYPEIVELKDLIAKLKSKIIQIPFIDTYDLRFNNMTTQPKSSTQAVMFCLMDVSGSMDETRKELAKRFFILLYLFLTRSYQTIELVFIRHHTTAKEVGEHEFFYSRETGGTVVSTALELMLQIVRERYPTAAWNIYAAQASDGDNWNADSPHCADLLAQQILVQVQYFAYVEILPQVHQNLWEAYEQLNQTYKNFAMRSIDTATDIYPVFRELFRKRLG